MARPTPPLLAALRATARRLEAGAPYAWSKLGLCNCGHLAQTITGWTSKEIQRRALQQPGDWAAQIQDYCPSTGAPMADLFVEMMALGLTRDDIAHLERLSDPAVLAHLPEGRAPLHHKRRADVVCYLDAWADSLEAELLPPIDVSPLTQAAAVLA